MKMMAVSVKDSKVGFGGIHLVPNEEVAKRDFSLLFKDKASSYAIYPSDYSLYSVGCFDTETGEFVSTIPSWLFDGTMFVGE